MVFIVLNTVRSEGVDSILAPTEMGRLNAGKIIVKIVKSEVFAQPVASPAASNAHGY
jgi:hypothetical protein